MKSLQQILNEILGFGNSSQVNDHVSKLIDAHHKDLDDKNVGNNGYKSATDTAIENIPSNLHKNVKHSLESHFKSNISMSNDHLDDIKNIMNTSRYTTISRRMAKKATPI